MTESEFTGLKDQIKQELKANLTNLSREVIEQEHSAMECFLATAPRISIDSDGTTNQQSQYPDDRTEDVARMAQSIPSTYDAAKKLAAPLLEQGKQPPPELGKFAAKVISGEIERPNPSSNKRVLTDLRNECLALAVWRFQRAGIHPTKAAESEKVSGCDLVADIYDELLANDAEGTIVKPKGGEFKPSTMRDIWLKDEAVKDYVSWLNASPTLWE